ncbi:MAG: matrixin family metalloprotease, partial [Myxococcaceae bacterium]
MTLRTLAVWLVLSPLPAGAFELKKDSTGASMRWSGGAAFVVDRRADVALDERRVFAAVQATVETLSAGAPGLALTLRAGPTTGVGYDFGQDAANQNEIVVVASSWPYDKDAIAVTVVTVDTRTHEILDADIALNAAAHGFKVLFAGGKEPAHGRPLDDIQNTLTHELGHALGLAHNPDDPGAVMYPLAHPGEISKRVLGEDDLAGLAYLYPEGGLEPSPPGAPGVGCSAGAGDLTGWVLLLVLPALLRRKAALARVAVTLALLAFPGAIQASAKVRSEAPAKQARVVATAEVLSRRTLPPAKGARLLYSELELSVRSCLKGPCTGRLRVTVPGGRLKDLEQLVDDLPVPERGELVGVTVAPAAGDPVPPRAQVYRLSRVRDFAAFARGVSAAGIAVKLPLPGSPPAPPGTPPPPPPAPPPPKTPPPRWPP